MPTKDAERQRLWRLNNPDAAKAAVDRYREKNADLIRQRQRDARDPEKGKAKYLKRKEAQKFYYVQKTYGLSREDYDQRLVAQDNACPVCRRLFGEVLVPVVDHDHETGAVRGLLCDRCNRGLGCFEDKAEMLASAARYLGYEFVRDPAMIPLMGKKTA